MSGFGVAQSPHFTYYRVVEDADADEVVPVEVSSRQPRTLGILTVGARAVGTGIAAAGKATGTAVAATAAAKPFILLGLGKCEWKPRRGRSWLSVLFAP